MLNILDVVGNFTGVLVAIIIGVLQYRHWKRRPGAVESAEIVVIPLQQAVARHLFNT